jgi:hypothetical protein
MLRLLLAEAGAGPPRKGVSMIPEMAPEMETLKGGSRKKRESQGNPP